MNTIYYNSELIEQNNKELEQYFIKSWECHGWKLKDISDRYPFSDKKNLLLENIGKLHEACGIERTIDTEMREARLFDPFFALLEDPEFNGGFLNDFSMVNLCFRPKDIRDEHKNKIVFYGRFGNLMYIPSKDSLNYLIDTFIESFNPDNEVFKQLYLYTMDKWPGRKEVDFRLYGLYIQNLESLGDNKIVYYQDNIIINKDIIVEDETLVDRLIRWSGAQMYWVSRIAIFKKNMLLKASSGEEKRILLYKYLSEQAEILSKQMGLIV